jgi:hypothetical protein
VTRQLVRLLAEALSYEREAFENGGQINSAEFMHWFVDWRQRLEQAVKS